MNVEQPGLQWRDELAGIEPHWTTEPSVDIIRTLAIKHLHIKDDTCRVYDNQYFPEGGFNKLYDISTTDGHFVLSVNLPVAPRLKTKSEVATLAFLREETDLPVPRVLAFDADFHNELGFEWVLMERVEGRCPDEVWGEMSWLKKGLLVQKVAEYTAQLFRIEFSGIGSLYLDESCYFVKKHDSRTEQSSKNYSVGQIVQPPFFKGDNVHVDIPRGPFVTSQEYLNTRLQLLEHFARALDLTDEDDLEHYNDIHAALKGLRSLIPHLFPNTSTETTTLSNPNLSASNILVSPSGTLLTIANWSCSATLPPYAAVDLPAFLRGPTRNEPPHFTDNTASEVYAHELALYETTCLRRFFLEEMARREPRWVQVFEQQRTRRDVLVALEKCENERTVKWVRGWLEVVEQGREPRVGLADGCRNPLRVH